jgi:Uma2 family endonuclease
MVLEVVSDTSARKDLLEHVEDYAAAGIHEYWLADAARSPELVFRILTLAPDRTYVAQPMDTDGWVASPLWGRRFRVRRFIDRVGLSDFALDVVG